MILNLLIREFAGAGLALLALGLLLLDLIRSLGFKTRPSRPQIHWVLKRAYLFLVQRLIPVAIHHLNFHLLVFLHLRMSQFINLVSNLIFLVWWLKVRNLVWGLFRYRRLCGWEFVFLSSGWERLKPWWIVRVNGIILTGPYIASQNIEVHSIILNPLLEIGAFFSIFWRVLIMIKRLKLLFWLDISGCRVLFIWVRHLAPATLGAFSPVGPLGLQVIELRLKHLRLIKARRSYRREVLQHHVIVVLRVVPWLVHNTLRLRDYGLIEAHSEPQVRFHVVGCEVLLNFPIDPLIGGLLGLLRRNVPSVN